MPSAGASGLPGWQILLCLEEISHQCKIENYFGIYYAALDRERKEMLSQEYKIRDQMESFEYEMVRLLDRATNYSVVEFFHE